MRLDTYERMPEGMRTYLSSNGWHFSRKMAEWAVSLMRDREGNKVKAKDKDSLHELLKANNVPTDKITGYDAVYVEAMARSDYFGYSLLTEAQVMKFVGDYIGDKDGYDGMPLTRFYADCIGKGLPVFWEDLL